MKSGVRWFFDRFDNGKDPSKFMQWVEHHPRLMVLILGLVAVYRELLDDHLPFWLVTINIVVNWAVIIIFFKSLIAHMRGFCDACFNQPLGGPVTAEKHRRALQLYHWEVEHTKIYIGMILLYMIVGITLIPRGMATALSLVPVYFSLASFARAKMLHQWLVPWCPWCKDGDEGAGAELPDPVPSGTKSNS